MAAVVALLLAVATPASVAARFNDADTVTGNAFTSASCLKTDAKTVQRGTTTSTANGIKTVNISTVDTTKAYLMFNVRSNSNVPPDSTVRGRLASATTLEFERYTNTGSPPTITIQWHVVEFYCGVKVQRGEATMSATSVNVTITAVSSTARSFVLWSKTNNNVSLNFDGNDMVFGTLTSTTNLLLRTNATDSTHHTVSWQVIEYVNSGTANVQRGTTSMTGTTTSTTVTISAVDTTKTFVLVGLRTSASGADIGARLIRAVLTDSTTITIDRGISGTPDDLTEISWQAVELNDGSTVQHGSANIANGSASTTAALSAVNPDRTVAFASTQESAGQGSGKTAYSGDDIPGVAQATLEVTSSTQLTLTRGNTAAAADIAWYVIEFPITCGRAHLVQSGQFSTILSGTTTVNISSVDTSRSYLMFNISSNSNNPSDSTVRGRLASATTVEFIRLATGPVTIVQWYVVSFSCGVTVQRGDTTLNATTINTAISSVGSLGRAYVTWSTTGQTGSTAWDDNDTVLATLTTTTNLQIKLNEVDSTPHTMSWQVISYSSDSDIAVQRGTTSLTGTATSSSVTLGTAVDLSKAFVLVGFTSTGSGADIGSRLLKGRLTDSTTLVISRDISGTPDVIEEISWQVIHLKEGSSVQYGTATLTGAASTTAALSSVDTSRVVAFASTQEGGGQASGSTDYASDDIPGTAQATLAVTSATQLTVTRGTTAGNASISWFVIQFSTG